jgi:formylmethanofuran dehydrogenase subunit E
MGKSEFIRPFSDVTRFHGHVCPGTAIGYRAGEIALKNLRSSRATDEEFVAIVENDSCSVDAIQVVTGCTMGKGNLIFKDHGKHVYTLLNRDTGKALRLSLNKSIDEIDSDFAKVRDKAFSESSRPEDKLEFEKKKDQISLKILDVSDEELFKIEGVRVDVPKARVFPSIKCAKCGELVAENKARIENGEIVCIPCFHDYSST